MAGISPTKLASARLKFEKLMPDRCTVTRVTVTQDTTTGGYTEAEALFASGIPCRVDGLGLNPREYPVSGRQSSVAEFTIMLSASASRWPGGVIDVRPTDRLTVTGGGGGVYEPVSAGGPVTDEIVREVRANRIA